MTKCRDCNQMNSSHNELYVHTCTRTFENDMSVSKVFSENNSDHSDQQSLHATKPFRRKCRSMEKNRKSKLNFQQIRDQPIAWNLNNIFLNLHNWRIVQVFKTNILLPNDKIIFISFSWKVAKMRIRGQREASDCPVITHISLVDYSILINWTSPLPI